MCSHCYCKWEDLGSLLKGGVNKYTFNPISPQHFDSFFSSHQHLKYRSLGDRGNELALVEDGKHNVHTTVLTRWETWAESPASPQSPNSKVPSSQDQNCSASPSCSSRKCYFLTQPAASLPISGSKAKLLWWLQLLPWIQEQLDECWCKESRNALFTITIRAGMPTSQSQALRTGDCRVSVSE